MSNQPRRPPEPTPLEITPPPTPTSSPRLTQVAIAEPQPTIYQWKCSKGHVAPMIGLVLSTAMLAGVTDTQRGTLRDRRFCFQCLTEALDKLGVSEVERVD